MSETLAVQPVWQRAPATLALLGLSILGFLLVYLPFPFSWVSYLTFTPFEIRGEMIRFGEMGGQYWRFLTPAFLHFGWLHIVFNGLWLWELGHRVEVLLGSRMLLALFLLVALLSNGAQYLFGGPAIFGGMSGVVYGLLGFSWVAGRLRPGWALEPPRPIMLLMVGWLVVCLLGIVETLGFGAIANAAHLGGLLAGALLGLPVAWLAGAGRRGRTRL